LLMIRSSYLQEFWWSGVLAMTMKPVSSMRLRSN